MYIVIKKFRDLKDNNHIYNENDFYPYCLKEIDEERALELKSDTNNFKEPVIRELTEAEVKMLNIVILDFEKENEEIDNIDKTKHSNKKNSNNI